MNLGHYPQNDAQRFGAVLKGLRERSGWTQKQRAQRAGVSRQTWWNCENGRHQPVLPVLLELLDAVESDLAELGSELGRS